MRIECRRGNARRRSSPGKAAAVRPEERAAAPAAAASTGRFLLLKNPFPCPTPVIVRVFAVNRTNRNTMEVDAFRTR